jgi:molybdopterin biosynthesis enzyme MoaB
MEAMRVHGFRWTLRTVLFGSLAGVTGRTIIVTPPGSSKGIEESLDAL